MEDGSGSRATTSAQCRQDVVQAIRTRTARSGQHEPHSWIPAQNPGLHDLSHQSITRMFFILKMPYFPFYTHGLQSAFTGGVKKSALVFGMEKTIFSVTPAEQQFPGRSAWPSGLPGTSSRFLTAHARG